MIRSLRLWVVTSSFVLALIALPAHAADSPEDSGTLEPTHKPMPPPEKKVYTTDYLFAITRSVTNSTIVPAGRVPLMFLTIPCDIVFLPIEAIAGFFPDNGD